MGESLSLAELDFFVSDPDKLQVYLRIREQLMQIAPDSVLRVLKTTIAFDAPRPFVYVSHPFTKRDPNWPQPRLMLSFSADQAYEHQNLVNPAYIRPGVYTLHAVIPAPGDIPVEILDLIVKSHENKNKRSKR